MHKQKPKSRSHTKNNFFRPQNLAWIVPLGLLVIAGCIYLAWVLQAPQREQAAQVERLNANAAKLQEVKEKLEKELPNVKKASFEKSCGQASAKFGEGAITCGGYITMVVGGVDKGYLPELRQLIRDEINSGPRIKIEGFQDINNDPEYPGVYEIVQKQENEHAICSIYENYYSSSQKYNHINNTSLNNDKGVYEFLVDCQEKTPNFLDGYKIIQ